jgi:CDGSH-type Zn-finger protein/uncharacterized Fe-S cluster protein YjdI
MAATTDTELPPSREHLLHLLYEASELEHTLMCTYLYGAFSLKRQGEGGLDSAQSELVERWRRELILVATEEMYHLTSVWNITSALGGAPRFGRGNFPLDAGTLPARLVVKLAPFDGALLQHFVHLERPTVSDEAEGLGFEPEFSFRRDSQRLRLVPMAPDYETVGAFYEHLGRSLQRFVAFHGESVAFIGDPALQLSSAELGRFELTPVICSKTALRAFTSIVEQGEGAPEHSDDSHFRRFSVVRDELSRALAEDPNFVAAFPAARNPVLRSPLVPQGRVYLENEEAWLTVDLANTAYALMMRLLAHAYTVPRPSSEKSLAVDLALGLMRVVADLGERAARLPAGPSHPGENAGMSFTALRDGAALPGGAGAWRFFRERLHEMSLSAESLGAQDDPRVERTCRVLKELFARASRAEVARPVVPLAAVPHSTPSDGNTSPTPVLIDGVEHIEGRDLTLLYEGKRCIHARFCVTGAPEVFRANVQGPWISPDAMSAEALREIAHLCPSGAIRYARKDGGPEEAPPQVNLWAVREAGPYAVRGELRIDGFPMQTRATLCRCGASKNKPYCDGSHKEVNFTASGEPLTGEQTAMLDVRNGPLEIQPLTDGPLSVRGSLEIVSGTGRMVARLRQARFCRCGGSANKPYCDGSHARIGFRSS